MENKLGLGMLVALVFSTMVGAGIFSLPQNVAVSASPGAITLGWLITGCGMLALVSVLRNLVVRYPNLNGGIFSYAQAGFGNYIGFMSAWGYWICNLLANVSYAVVFFSAIGYFVDTPENPIMGQGNTPIAILGGSLLIWFMHALVLRGVTRAALINIFATIAKIIPILTFICLVVMAFKLDKFTLDFWGDKTPELGSVLEQVKATMMVTLWVFIGIEGAVILSNRAKDKRDVAKATGIALCSALILYIAVSLFTLGVMTQPEVAALQNPSMAHILEVIVGPWGAMLINAGLIISVSGALLSWTVVSAEVPFIAAKEGLFPKAFTKENHNGAATTSLWFSSCLVQLFLILTLLQESSYLALVNIATSAVLLPYFLVGAYGVKVALSGEGYSATESRKKDLVIALVSSFYGAWLVYAAGVEYMLLCALLYLPGVLVYKKALSEKQQAFSKRDYAYSLLLLAGAAGAIYLLSTGVLSLS
ncbi:basic amino acid/polyamine antiporter [Moritella sp.]|uniref:basic amino acid/polyamine antiporter n=1 Tax=Moritella sp. TaxID=78556 RepID=UPI001D6EE0FB|nr:basic amino acid/polyamine antiporter [Moritella sp.]MCJ8348675.1 basic amino acid/polyamine antiporter [Moritella sp.]NQZ41279.1 amino acid permease [Moritella sp.]